MDYEQRLKDRERRIQREKQRESEKHRLKQKESDDSIFNILWNMGFTDHYIQRSLKVYAKQYNIVKYGYHIEIITEIIFRLTVKDKLKQSQTIYLSKTNLKQALERMNFSSYYIQIALSQYETIHGKSPYNIKLITENIMNLRAVDYRKKKKTKLQKPAQITSRISFDTNSTDEENNKYTKMDGADEDEFQQESSNTIRNINWHTNNKKPQLQHETISIHAINSYCIDCDDPIERNSIICNVCLAMSTFDVAIHHEMYPITQKREQFNNIFSVMGQYFCGMFALVVIWIGVSSLIGYAASQIFIAAMHKTQQNNAFINSFNIDGECIITQRKQQSSLTVTSYYHIYQYKIYNRPSCNGTNNTYSMTETVDVRKSAYKYNISDIFTCIANENCEIIHDKYEVEHRRHDIANGGVYFAGVLVCICACISCATPSWIYCREPDKLKQFLSMNKFETILMEWSEYVKYKSGEDKELHYVYQWNNIMTDKQRIEYYVNYYGRKYELNMYDTINEMLFTYAVNVKSSFV